MISIRNYESKLSMDEEYELTLLLDGKMVTGREVVTHGDSVYIRTWDEDIPIYAFKMNRELQRILKDGYDIWNS